MNTELAAEIAAEIDGLDTALAGLKTAAWVVTDRYLIEKAGKTLKAPTEDVCETFQGGVIFSVRGDVEAVRAAEKRLCRLLWHVNQSDLDFPAPVPQRVALMGELGPAWMTGGLAVAGLASHPAFADSLAIRVEGCGVQWVPAVREYLRRLKAALQAELTEGPQVAAAQPLQVELVGGLPLTVTTTADVVIDFEPVPEDPTYLSVDGVKVPQSQAVALYFADKYPRPGCYRPSDWSRLEPQARLKYLVENEVYVDTDLVKSVYGRVPSWLTHKTQVVQYFDSKGFDSIWRNVRRARKKLEGDEVRTPRHALTPAENAAGRQNARLPTKASPIEACLERLADWFADGNTLDEDYPDDLIDKIRSLGLKPPKSNVEKANLLKQLEALGTAK